MKDAYTFSFLKAQDMPEVHQVFLEAFADYFVPIQLTAVQFQAKLKRESINPAFCVAAYEGTKIVAFILTGLGEYNGMPTAYNAGTGVLPEHRGNQLTCRLYTFLLPKLRQSGIEQCLLEVIQENEPALQSYKAIGLTISRALDCFRAKKEDLLLAGEVEERIAITTVAKPDWEIYQHFCEIKPTWQNSATALVKSPDEKVILEARTENQETVGYAIFFPKNGAIAQLAVLPPQRRKGIGKALLRELYQLTTAPALMLINVDAGNLEFKEFLERRHFNKFLGQYEMLMPLT